MNKPSYLPDGERLSILAAIILLAYTLARMVNFPVQDFGLQLPGIYLSVEVSIRTIVAILVAALTATGADWLLRDHPDLQHRSALEHILLPMLTAWVIGIPLFQLPMGFTWWVGITVGVILLVLVLVAEYIVIDPDDVRQPVAAAGLTALSFGLFLILGITLRSLPVRLFLLLPSITLAGWLVSLRSFRLRLHGRWALLQATLVALLIGQAAAAFHYWPLTPTSFGLVLLAPAYALTSFLGALADGTSLRDALIEPVLISTLVLGAAWWFR